MSHGTLTRYRVNGCRCELCREANAEYQWAYRHGYRAPQPRTPIAVKVDRALLGELLRDLFPNGLTDDCPARRHRR